jgi:hypothetical protein
VATRDEVIQELDRLVGAFPNQALTPGMVEVYVEQMGMFGAMAVHDAVTKAIQLGTFFPRVAELRRFSLGGDLRQAPDYLRGMAQELEDNFYQGIFEAGKWEGLAVRFEGADRPHGAEEIRRKAREYGAVCRVQQVGEEAGGGGGGGEGGDAGEGCGALEELRGVPGVVGRAKEDC